MEKWKQKLGSKATYNNLIKAFKRAGYKIYADTVIGLVKIMQTNSNDSNSNTIDQTPPPSKQSLSQLPVFPEPKQLPKPPPYATADGAKLLQEDNELGIY